MPTVAESGYPGFETVTWFGLMAPAGISDDILNRLRTETARVLRRPDVQKQLAQQGASATLDQGPEDFTRFIQAETEKLGKRISIIGRKAD